MIGLSYAVVTPVRDEAENVGRLADCLAAQTSPPFAWIVVDDGSEDGTAELVASLAREHPWIRPVPGPGEQLARGAPIVRAFYAGLLALDGEPDVVAKIDADISIEPDHFARLLAAFERDPALGVAGGSGYERQPDGAWRERHGTGPAVWGGCRAYRRECLEQILPLEEHMGWDTLDLMKANLKGWKTEVLYDVPFRHHRVEGERDGRRWRTTTIQGEAAYFMGYRPSYLLVRTFYRMLRDPASLGLLAGYARARAKRNPRLADRELRAYVRRQQSLRRLPARAREALRPRAALVDGP
jgi:biofilm PGA synthesis N-glycosyltransferase PgaC